MLDFLKGKKTYIAAGLMVVYSLSGLILGHVEPAEAWALMLEAFAVFGIRNALKEMEW